MKKERISLKFEISIEVPYTYDPNNYSPRRNKKVEKAIMNWLSEKNIKYNITNGNNDIPFYVETDETGAYIEEITDPIKVRITNIYEV